MTAMMTMPAASGRGWSLLTARSAEAPAIELIVDQPTHAMPAVCRQPAATVAGEHGHAQLSRVGNQMLKPNAKRPMII